MGKTGTRIYKVSVTNDNGTDLDVRLIRAISQAAAERFAFKDLVKATRVKEYDLVELLEGGIKVEEAGEDGKGTSNRGFAVTPHINKPTR